MTDLHEKHGAGYFEALDGWRGICASMVALFHFRAFSHISDSDFIKSGGSFLDFFFVLSGFVIFANYYERLKSGYSLRDFMLLRFGRLYPLHFALFFLLIAGDLAQLIIPWLSKGATYAPFSGPGESMCDVIANILLIHSFNVTDMLSFNAPSWSISAEFYTYLLFGAAISLTRGRFFIVGFITSGMLIFILNDPERMKGTFHLGVFRCIYGFGCGGLTWFIFRKFKDRLMHFKTQYFNIVEVALFVGLFVYAHYLLMLFDILPYFQISAPLVFSFTVFIFAFQKGIISKMLMGRFFSLLGMLSYSIYMTHIIISGKIFYGFGHLAQKISGLQLFSKMNGADILGTNIWMGDIICLIYITSVVACSYVTYRLIEVPCRDRFRKFVRKSEGIKA